MILLLTICVSQIIYSLDYLVGQWVVSKYVDEKKWLEIKPNALARHF